MFLCNGCGVTFPRSNMAAYLSPMSGSKEDDHLCSDCYKAIQIFLNNRINEKGKGVNTGFVSYSDYITDLIPNISGCSGGSGMWTSIGIPINTPGKRTPCGSVHDVPTNKPVNTNGEKKRKRRTKK